jgi:hypothetical protein
MSLMVAVFRAPMRSRNDAVEPQATIDRARRLGLCGFGQSVSRSAEPERLVRRVARFAELDEGSFVAESLARQIGSSLPYLACRTLEVAVTQRIAPPLATALPIGH